MLDAAAAVGSGIAGEDAARQCRRGGVLPEPTRLLLRSSRHSLFFKRGESRRIRREIFRPCWAGGWNLGNTSRMSARSRSVSTDFPRQREIAARLESAGMKVILD